MSDKLNNASAKANEYLDMFEDREMADYVRVYVDYVNSLIVDSDDFAIEQRVDYSDWVPGGFGTADAVVLRGQTLHVIDLKYGMGVRVDAEENPQGMLYALGAYSCYSMITDIEDVVISIVQPRLDHISEWKINTRDLLKWAELAKQRAEATQEPDAPRQPGEKQCRFCKAKATCEALYDYTAKVLGSEFDLCHFLSPFRLVQHHAAIIR